MTIPVPAIGHLDSQLNEIFQNAGKGELLGGMFAGCVVYFDHTHESKEINTWDIVRVRV
jgi:hypothetical protein